MINKLSYKDVEIDFKKGTIVTLNGGKSSLDECDDSEVVNVIKGNIEYHQRRIEHLNERLSVKEETIIPFKGGYKIREPLTEGARKKFEVSVKEHTDEIKELNKLLNKYSNG